MLEQNSPVRAAIDVGSNTIHIVVAACTPNDLQILVDEDEVVRIGESVNTSGSISAQKQKAAIAVLQRYKALAEQHGAVQILVVATEAIRKARNSLAFCEAVSRETGLTVQLIGGETEALLTFYGATYEAVRSNTVPELIGVMDLGGGSTELVTAHHMRINWRVSVPLGSGWLHDRYLLADPPSQEQMEVAQAFLQTYFEGMQIPYRPETLIATGGSARTLLWLVQEAFPVPERGASLSLADLRQCEDLLQEWPAATITERYGIPEVRARLLPAGALIIHALMEQLGLSTIQVSSHGIREGTLLVYERYGTRWLELLEQEEELLNAEQQGEAERMLSESFGETGRRLLREWALKVEAWREKVEANEDSEAVHKMRVATRRLRAVMGAYHDVSRPRKWKKALRRVKELARMLGNARDSDVISKHIAQYQVEASPAQEAGIHWLKGRLEHYRQTYQQLLVDYLQDFDTRKLYTLLQASIPEPAKAPQASLERLTASTEQCVRSVVQEHLEKMYRWSAYVETENGPVHELHKMRIAAKRLRYSLELFQDVLPPLCRKLAKEVEQIQSELGQLHDSDVLIALIQLCLAVQAHEEGLARLDPELLAYLTEARTDLSPLEAQGLRELLARVEGRRKEQYRVFRQHWKKLQERDFRGEILAVLCA
ncbi:exopolyphosphatase/pppGpp-phosphohydrolase [Thermosporothrix hazakensis]|jgi:exopolyphosphatase/pppGpp-phosphohydrolase|uniref:Exopolyphosphatase/pppGpp-phosphohydrolase n=1 Tax=Thermosporothrix hazakensis TaxID=644383 RepID=A0A326UB14_THEHA|nr:CHAD domain-containing protein [Thermosporothrix hazakensis]PZW32878.1 exopolyphosphatase/pppGpp-phosphohydrolase [Thermosporothrix hazakensis]GCE48910.1 hypothetical protein KTH_37790 [Thermosporothrix hazakensis]